MFIYYFITLLWCEWWIGKVIKLRKMQFKIYALIHIFQSHSVGRFGFFVRPKVVPKPYVWHPRIRAHQVNPTPSSNTLQFSQGNFYNSRRHFVATFVFLMHSWQCCQLTLTLSHHTHTHTLTHVFVTLVLCICNQTGTKFAKHFWCLVCLKASSASCGCFSFPLLTVSSQRRAISPTVLNRQAPKKRERKKKGRKRETEIATGKEMEKKERHR